MDDERRMKRASSGPILCGLDEIGRLFGRNRSTVARWIRDERFPCARLPSGEYVATLQMVDGWLEERRVAQAVREVEVE